jgi:heme exporter protein A
MPLEIDTLTVTRGGRVVLSNVSARVGEGEGLALMGRNGAGKTTLLRTIAGFLTPDQGQVRFRATTSTPDLPIAEQAHFVGHLDGVKGALTVGENAQFWCEYLGGAAVRIDAALARVGVAELSAIGVRFLSAGQKRRLALARLLLVARPLWLLDEPTASLDAAGQTLLVEMATAHLGAGGTIVAATHVDLGFPNTRALTLGGAGAQ